MIRHRAASKTMCGAVKEGPGPTELCRRVVAGLRATLRPRRAAAAHVYMCCSAGRRLDVRIARLAPMNGGRGRAPFGELGPANVALDLSPREPVTAQTLAIVSFAGRCSQSARSRGELELAPTCCGVSESGRRRRVPFDRRLKGSVGSSLKW